MTKPKVVRSSMSLLRNVKAYLTPTLTPSGSSSQLAADGKFRKVKTEAELFPATDPAVDGDECTRDCDGCTVHYPAKFSVEESDKLFGHVNGFSTHLIVGTGKTDWVRDVTDEKHSVMQAVGKYGVEARNGKVMLSASNMPSGEECDGADAEEGTADCILLPSWVLIEAVRPSQVPLLMGEVVEKSVTNGEPLGGRKANGHADKTSGTNGASTASESDKESDVPDVSGLRIGNGSTTGHEPANNDTATDAEKETPSLEPQPITPALQASFKIRALPHSYLILMCSHKTRDARCGQSAPLLRKEFERILRPMGLYRDLHDDRPGGVGIYFINHVGGHKYSANVMIYRRQGRRKDGGEDLDGAPLQKEAVQLMWLARVRPEDCENIVRYTILQGKLVKPTRQLRAGFDRERGLASW